MTNGLFGLLNLDMDSYHILGGHKTLWEWLRGMIIGMSIMTIGRGRPGRHGATWTDVGRHGATWDGMDRPGHFERPYHLEPTRIGLSHLSSAAFPPQVFLLYLHRLQN